jgi:hypothetical protein
VFATLNNHILSKLLQNYLFYPLSKSGVFLQRISAIVVVRKPYGPQVYCFSHCSPLLAITWGALRIGWKVWNFSAEKIRAFL